MITKKAPVLIAHLTIILAVLLSSEPFNRTDISLPIMLLCLGFLLIFYNIFCTLKLEYVPIFHILVALISFVLWVVLMYTANLWSNLRSWNRLIYIVYPFYSGIFLLCLPVMNFIVFLIRKSKKSVSTDNVKDIYPE